MVSNKLNFETFKAEKIDTKQLKMVRGGDDTTVIDGNKDPNKSGGGIAG
ncbi:hypothetical protein [Pseudomonas shirazensis]